MYNLLGLNFPKKEFLLNDLEARFRKTVITFLKKAAILYNRLTSDNNAILYVYNNATETEVCLLLM